MSRLSLLLLTSVLWLTVTFAVDAAPAPKVFGAGIMLGEPTGVSMKFWMSEQSAIDAAAAWSFVGGGSFYAHLDYLQHFYNIFPVSVGALPLYVGIGGVIRATSSPGIGVRIPFGVTYLFQNAPLDAFLEIALEVQIFPATTVEGGGGIGIRYYF